MLNLKIDPWILIRDNSNVRHVIIDENRALPGYSIDYLCTEVNSAMLMMVISLGNYPGICSPYLWG